MHPFLSGTRPLIRVFACSLARSLAVLALAPLSLSGHGAALKETSSSSIPGRNQVKQALSDMVVPFEQNTGQWDQQVAFMARTFAGTVFVTRDGQMVYSLPGKPLHTHGATDASEAAEHTPDKRVQARGPGWRLTESLPGAAPLKPQGIHQAQAQVNRFTAGGSFRNSTWQSVMVGEPWPGIQLELAARGSNVEKLFHVAAGADAKAIEVQLSGVTGARLGADGALVVGTGNGEISYTAPVAWQDIEGQRVPVAVHYALHPSATASETAAGASPSQTQRYGFALAAYDARYPLVIDPLIQSTYLGGDAAQDHINDMAITSDGDVIVGGFTFSAPLPGVANGAQSSKGDDLDAFMTRLSGDLKTIRQSTYLGGNDSDLILGLALGAWQRR